MHNDLTTAEPPTCLGPLPVTQPPDFILPPDACDTHAHVISPDIGTYPLVEDRSYTPAVATEAQYLDMLDTLGFSRGVLVQPSIYGTDNGYLLDVLARNPGRLRGVAVVSPEISDRELQRMHALGVRGVRFNLLFRGGLDLLQLERMDARIASYGWHLQFLIDVRDLTFLAERLARLCCPVVIDHMGHLPAVNGLNNPGFLRLLDGLERLDWWVKLSGTYRLSTRYPDFAEADALACRLLDTRADRLLWGSDWPHVAQQQIPNTTRLLNRLATWAPSPALRHRILVDNPRELYDFK